MLTKLKNRLVLFYGFSTTIILSIVMIVVFLMNGRQQEQYEKDMFANNVSQITDQLMDVTSLNTKWLIQFQQNNQLLIQIVDNNVVVPSYFQLHTKVAPTILYDSLYNLVTKEGNILDRLPINSHTYTSKLYKLNSSFQESYLGCITRTTTDNCDRIIYIIKRIQNPGLETIYAGIKYILLTVFGSSLLFLFSFLFIKKVIQPVEEGQQKQVEFIAAASHELRSPLTVIQTGLTTIRKNPEKTDSILPHIESESCRMVTLINDLLLLASSDAKTWLLSLEPIDTETLLIDVYDTFCTLYNTSKMPIELNLTDECLPALVGDSNRIKQVLTILMDNALRFTNKEKGILLQVTTLTKKIEYIAIDVIDYGPGIPDSQKSKVFDRFYQGDQSRTDKKHYGLGLSIAKELIHKHGGSITVLDTPSGGATIRILLPTRNVK